MTRRLCPVFSAFVFAILLGGCGGGGGSTPVVSSPMTNSAGSIVRNSSFDVRSRSQFAGILRTPALPPLRRHRVTAAERARARAAGWQMLVAPAFANGPGTELLMTDGTVMVQSGCTTAWYGLTPDKNGSYLHGTWKPRASMPSGYAPLYFASAVLADGKLIVNGGEYNFCHGVETTLGAIYDPVANSWTSVSPPSGWSSIGDGQSVVLDDGTYMIGNCCTSVQALLNESKLTWTQTGNGKQDVNSEEGWTLLPSGNVLTVDVTDVPQSEAYNPKANMWASAGQLPVNLIAGEEIGPQTLMPNGSVFVAGADGDTALYNSKSGGWAKGPTFPTVSGQQLDVADGPSTVLTDGTVMIAASPGLYKTPASFFIFDGKKLKSIVPPPQAPNDSSFNLRLLLLPTGQVLEVDGSGDIELYTSTAKPDGAIAPAIASVPTTLHSGSTYKISGKRFNGFTQANMYGDDVQQATNYPLVRIVNTATGHVFYARTHGHSFMGVGSQSMISTMFDVPAGIESGPSTLVVVTNGIPSQAVNVTIQ
jgi:hypothetical protein